jgi:uncharacterized protein (TIGR02145 family)
MKKWFCCPYPGKGTGNGPKVSRFILVLSCFFSMTILGHAQVGINQDQSEPDPAAMLDVKSTTKGFLPPRLTTGQMNAVVTPPNGLIVYNTSVNALYWFDGTTWKKFNENSFTETDPVFLAHPSSGISASDLLNWNTAFGSRIVTVTGTAPVNLTFLNNMLTASIPAASALADGYLTSTDWSSFNSKVSSQWVTGASGISYQAGAVAVGSASADPSALLDLSSVNKGFLPPRVALTSADVAAPVTSPASGLFIYNTATAGTPPNNVAPGYYCWKGARWVPVIIPDGANPGDMLYWNGTSWVIVPVGINGQVLTLNNGIPVWGGVQLPLVITNAATSVLAISAVSGGFICSDGGSPVTERGVCWNTIPGPTIANNKSFSGTGPGSFTVTMTPLAPSTAYYARAYATNAQGTAYGNEITLTTLSGSVTITTNSVTSIQALSALSGGYISSDGGAPVTVRGACWSTSTGPTVNDFKTTSGSGTGSFSSSLTSLSASATYFVRAYATNSTGTYYGNELTFTTQSGVATVTTTAVTSIMAQAASSGGSITSDGGSAITARGVCWSTLTGPTVNDFKTTNGSGTGTFSSSLAGLNASTTYYIRAYATNAVGTWYGGELVFTTQSGVASLTTTAATAVMAQTATSGGMITSDGGSAITARGVCWSTAPNPTINDSKTSNGSGTGSFTSNLSGLSSSTTYYVRAYATNAVGTWYGNAISFTTQSGIVSLATTAATNISFYTATSGGTITSDGGSAVTVRGVCWSINPNPTTANSKTLDGSGTGTFTSSMAGLAMNTVYFVRAYATNAIGTWYGNEITIHTKDCSILTDPRDGQTYTALMIGNQCWMAENLNYGLKIFGVNEQTNNGIVEKYCYDNLDANCDVYGGMYQWGEAIQYLNGASNTTSWNPVPTGNIQGICPPGWHVPKDQEFSTLSSAIGGTGIGGQMKEAGYAHWAPPNTGATNSSGFTALPNGYRWVDNAFHAIFTSCQFWTATQTGSYDAYYRNVNYQSADFYQFQFEKPCGHGIRCVQD